MLGVRISREVRGARGEDGGVAPSRTEYAPRLASLASPLSEGAGAANGAEFLDQSSAMRVSFSLWTAWQALSLWVASGVSGCESASVRTFVESVRPHRTRWWTSAGTDVIIDMIDGCVQEPDAIAWSNRTAPAAKTSSAGDV